MRKLLRMMLPTLTLCSPSVPEPARASGEATFTKLLDSETPIPGWSGTIGPFDVLEYDGDMAMDPGGNLVFAAGGVFAIIESQLHLVPHPEGDLYHVAIHGSQVGDHRSRRESCGRHLSMGAWNRAHRDRRRAHPSIRR